MGVSLSLVCPFKPVPIGYKPYQAASRYNTKFEHPLSAWALACADTSTTAKSVWEEHVAESKAINEQNKVSNCLAFPRFVPARKVNSNKKYIAVKPVRTMKTFRDDHFEIKTRSGESRACLSHNFVAHREMPDSSSTWIRTSMDATSLSPTY